MIIFNFLNIFHFPLLYIILLESFQTKRNNLMISFSEIFFEILSKIASIMN